MLPVKPEILDFHHNRISNEKVLHIELLDDAVRTVPWHWGTHSSMNKQNKIKYMWTTN